MKAASPPGTKCPAGPFGRFAALVDGGAVLTMTARFGRSTVREAAYDLRARHRNLDIRLSWTLFATLDDWGTRWPVERHTFAAGLILSAKDDPIVERAVGRCIADLAALGRPLLWGVTNGRIRWHTRFTMGPNGWPPEEFLPPPATYARLCVVRDGAEFRPQFDPILYSPDPDFFIYNSRLRWWDARHSNLARRDGCVS